MVSVKKRVVKGKSYLYVAATSSYMGKKKRFERSVGPADMDPDLLAGRVEFFSEIVELRSILYRIYLEVKQTEYRFLSRFYSLYLTMVRNFYSPYLRDLYPSELEKYQDDQRVKYIHHTTALEGNTLSLMEAALVLEEGIAPSGKRLREIHEVENFKKLTRFMKGYKGDITLDLINKVHSLVQRGIDDDQAGNLRRIEVGVVGSTFQPPPALVVEAEIRELIDWYRKNPDHLPAFELAAAFHLRFVQIHPFSDGNGRVARELMNFILQRNGYPPLIVEVEDREHYLKRLQKADEGDPAPFIEMLALKMITDYEDVIFSFQTKAFQSVEGLTREEFDEIMKTLLEFVSLMSEFEIEVPEEARKKVKTIKRYLEIFGTLRSKPPARTGEITRNE